MQTRKKIMVCTTSEGPVVWFGSRTFAETTLPYWPNRDFTSLAVHHQLKHTQRSWKLTGASLPI